MIKPPYKRRDIATKQPDILGHYHEFLMTNNLPGYEKLLDEYQPHISWEERKELIDDFKHGVELLLRRRWHLPK
jgi:hypothetical protein